MANETIWLIMIILFNLIPIFLLLKKKTTPPQNQKAPQTQKAPSSEWENWENPQTQPQNLNISPEVSMAKKMELSFSAILAFFILSCFLAFGFAFSFPKYQVIFIIIGSFLFIPIGIFIGAISSSNFRIKLLRGITKKNIGYVKFVKANRVIKPVVANLDNDIIRYGQGLYIINKKWIKRESPDSSYSPIPIDEDKIKYEEGVPVVYFDIDDLLPIDFDNTEAKKSEQEKEKFRLPSHVAATLNKEIAVEKAKVMNAFSTRQTIIGLITIVAIIIVLYYVYSLQTQFKDMNKKIDPLVGKTDQISKDVNTLKSIIEARPITNQSEGLIPIGGV